MQRPNGPTGEEQPGCGQWLAVISLAAWLAAAPLLAASIVLPLTGNLPEIVVQLGLGMAGQSLLPEWAAGLAATLLALVLHLLAFVPAFVATRGPGWRFLHTAAALLMVIAVTLALSTLARLPWPDDPTRTAALQLALVLPFLLFGVAWAGAPQGGSLLARWRAIGLRLWQDGSTPWLALAVMAVALWPWVVVGSLGSAETTAASVVQALPAGLGEEILFRGIALSWLWRVAANRRMAAAGSLLLYAAAQGATVLPDGDFGVFPRFVAALLLGLLFTELTIRAGGSIWPAVIAHFLFEWVHLAFVDPRSEAEILHVAALVWAVGVMGLLGALLWLRRGAQRPKATAGGSITRSPGRLGLGAAVVLAVAGWVLVGGLYVTAGAPGFHPDGFLIYLDEQADLSQAASIADPMERRAWVVRALVETAERSQAPVRAELDRRGVRYRPHYLVNVIEVLERPGLRRAMATQPGVASVLFMPGVRPYPKTLPLPAADPTGPIGVEWNVQEVGADQVWAAGITGQGIVVGNADTGVEWDHPALKAAYLGWDGTGVAEHAYHWYDPWDGHAEPFDDNGHGTHTTGTMVGEDSGNQIGLAPGARWIACRNMRHGIGNAGAYVSCMEFLLAPFPAGGDPFHDGLPGRGAHVVNNSWGCPKQEGCQPDTLQIAVDHLRAAGQMMVVSAGNEGPVCSSVQDPPAIYDSVFSVGAISRHDRPAIFSSRGPVTVDGSSREKPDIVAPGVDIRSAMPGGYGVSSGTSMAGPHVTAAVALLWSAQPALIGDVGQTEEIINKTADRLTGDIAVCQASPGGSACPCGADQSDSVPNNVFGWGEVNAWAAVQAAR